MMVLNIFQCFIFFALRYSSTLLDSLSHVQGKRKSVEYSSLLSEEWRKKSVLPYCLLWNNIYGVVSGLACNRVSIGYVRNCNKLVKILSAMLVLSIFFPYFIF